MASANGQLNGADVSAIRAVAFDCYGTLLDFDERAFAPAIEDLLRRHGVLDVSGEAVWEKWMDAARTHAKANGRDPEHPFAGPEPVFSAFADTWPQYFAHAFRETGVEGVDPDAALGHMFDLMSVAPAYDEALEVIAALQSAGLTVAVASNADDVHLGPALSNAGIDVGLVLSSEGVRSYKPRRPFFDALCRELDASPEEIAYVGDSPFSDVTGARNVGMPAYWVRRYEDADREKHLHHQPTWTYPDLRGLLCVLLERTK